MPYTTPFPPPRQGLRAAAAQRAQERLDTRLAELRELAPLLSLLDREAQALETLGLTLEPETINLARERVGSSPTLRAVLRLYTGGTLEDPAKARAWIDALAGLGFSFVSQDDRPLRFPSVLLRKGLLLVRVDVPLAAAVQTTPARVA